jgi:hypothetical protein
MGQSARQAALTELVRPELGATPEPWRSLLEPLVAAAALGALVLLLAIGLGSLAALSLAAGLAYLILTRVFGLSWVQLRLDPSW